ncbi:MAG: hypothetical protein FWE35_16390 [Streptosporangiales bacterium]|nr:hypothetical protein [Streptosporangiales bacterium]
MPGDVAHDQHDVAVGHLQGVIPVAGHQVAGLGGTVPDGDVETLVVHVPFPRHDGPLQSDGQLVLLGRALLAVGELSAGGVQRDLGVVQRGDVLERAPQGGDLSRVGDRLGEHPDLPQRAVPGPDDAEHRGGGGVLGQQRLPETADQRLVACHDVAVELIQGNGAGVRRVEAEDVERGFGPVREPERQVLLPAAELSDALDVVEQLGQAAVLGGQPPPGEHDAALPGGRADVGHGNGVGGAGQRPGLAGDPLRAAVGQHLSGAGEQAAARGAAGVGLQQGQACH